ncbi:MAG: LemA family protein [Actinomycetota bacterium]|nr:LemA family protein [Actinomycetota bacterium]
MLPGIIILIVVLVLIALVVIGVGVGYYNSIVSIRNRVDNAWHQIDVQLRKRYDLIPNLVETVKGYAAHEKETLQQVIEARNAGMNAQSIKEHSEAENQITGTLKSLFALSERYPNLKADQHFSRLMEQLNGIESNIAYARQFFNDTVMKFNTRIETFPGNIFARIFNFKSKDYFEIEEEAARGPVKVEF